MRTGSYLDPLPSIIYHACRLLGSPSIGATHYLLANLGSPQSIEPERYSNQLNFRPYNSIIPHFGSFYGPFDASWKLFSLA